MSDDRLTNTAAEAALLGAMLLDNRVFVEWADRLRAEDFHEAVHQRIFRAITRFVSKGMAASAIALQPVFQHDEAADYGEYLNQLVDDAGAVVGATSFASQIIDLAARRATRAAMHTAMESLATDFEVPIAVIAGGVEETVWAAETRNTVIEASDAGEMVGLAEERDDRIRDDPGAVGMSNLLISDLDVCLGPLERGTYLIVAGRPGMGKSATAQSAALGYAANGEPVLYCFAEMTREQQALRMTADLSLALAPDRALAHEKLKKGGLSRDERVTLASVRERAATLPIRFVPTGPADIRRVWSLAARHKAMWAAQGRKLGLVVVDYAGLYSATDADGRPIEDDRKRMNKISRMCLEMAQNLDVAVMLLCQLGRSVEQRPNKRPQISDLKESGNLEQDADMVLLLFREEAYLADEEPKRGEQDKNGKDAHEEWEKDMNIVRGKIDFIVGKHRHKKRVTRTGRFFGAHYAVRGGEVTEYDTQPMLI